MLCEPYLGSTGARHRRCLAVVVGESLDSIMMIPLEKDGPPLTSQILIERSQLLFKRMKNESKRLGWPDENLELLAVVHGLPILSY
jgi:hypothetical protein